ncbi:hypothetical protein AWC38_SpisGene24118 [Stylophora pistillata]|uniref:Uncharacterized protein n=1 Tax=Stylophora pistillata TaxID=50429 RepID=A0A2B4R6U0_STYPI|nr:hypothetical protein AWC38_SpisGene24118 [Stylophora pistillata]
MLTTPEVNEIMASVPAQERKKTHVVAESCTDTSQLTVSQYAAAWDFIIMAITRNCRTRPGALETVNLGQLRAARWYEEETSKVILVTSHKRERAVVPPATPVKRAIVELDSSSESTERPPSKRRRQGSPSEAAGVVPPAPSRATKPYVAPAPATEGGEEEVDSSYEVGYDNEEDFFTEPNPNSPRHEWLVEFYKHLRTLWLVVFFCKEVLARKKSDEPIQKEQVMSLFKKEK